MLVIYIYTVLSTLFRAVWLHVGGILVCSDIALSLRHTGRMTSRLLSSLPVHLVGYQKTLHLSFCFLTMHTSSELAGCPETPPLPTCLLGCYAYHMIESPDCPLPLYGRMPSLVPVCPSGGQPQECRQRGKADHQEREGEQGILGEAKTKYFGISGLQKTLRASSCFRTGNILKTLKLWWNKLPCKLSCLSLLFYPN